MKLKFLISITFLIVLSSCVSTKSTLKNVDNKLAYPRLTKENTFVISETSKDPKYGYDKDYPVNIFFNNPNDENINPKRYFNSLTGPNGEKIIFTKTGICCPFPSKNIQTGGAFLDVYEISYEGLQVPLEIYINRYEKGAILAPLGFGLKK